MVLGNVIVEVTILRSSFVFGQLHAQVSASFTNVRSLAVAAFDLVYCSLSVLRFVFVFDISKQSIVSDVPLMYGIVAVVTGPELV